MCVKYARIIKFFIVFVFSQGKGDMETFWLLGHEQMQSSLSLSPFDIDDILSAVAYEPEFLQMI
jgi:hypothetical protein